jgi:spermidine synthase/MFS family permease
VFEVIWVRQLGLWVGHGAVAVSLVVAAFLLGLVLGNLVGARLADRGGDLVRVYAVLEAITGIAALVVSGALSQAAPLSTAVADHLPAVFSSLPVRVFVGFAVVLAPTTAMGATLPVLTRHLARTDNAVGAPLGTLYALNTLGAALGCALAGFWLLGRHGMLVTAAIASCTNLLVAVIADSLRGHDTAPTARAHDDRAATTDTRTLLIIATLTGFAAIACELLWLRVLHAFVKSSTYAFTLLLVVYLTGLVLGGSLYARRYATHPRPWALLADVQSLLAAATVASVALLGRAGTFASLIGTALGATAADDADLVHLALGAVVILAPATLMGVSFPLVAALGASHDPRGTGHGVGTLAAANTLGGALGSLATGLWLIPAVGTLRSFTLATIFSLVTSLAARARTAGGLVLRGDDGRTARLSLAVCLALALVPSDYLLRAVSSFPRARVLEVREGRDGTAAALGYDRATVCAVSSNHCRTRCTRNFSYAQLIFGTVSYASTIPPAKRYMRALAHLPMLQHSRNDRLNVVEVCFGTGTTAGAFAAHPSLRTLTLVDINRDVLGFARHFAESNHDVLRDPRVRVVIDDGRHHLATAQDRWDVVSLEPPPPTAEGAASLYTREFYVAARRAMTHDGIVAQWIPLDQQTADLNRAMLAAMLAEFRYVEVYIASREEGVILASNVSITPALDRWRARWQPPRVAASLAEVGFESPEALVATRVLDTAGVRRYVRGIAAMVDDLPAVEFYRGWPSSPFRVEEMFAMGTPAAPEGVSDVTVLARHTQSERLGMRAWERSIRGDLNGARAMVSEISTLTPTGYSEYLATLEFDCLNLDDP